MAPTPKPALLPNICKILVAAADFSLSSETVATLALLQASC